MKIGIIVAMEEELAPLLEQLNTELVDSRKKIEVRNGSYKQHELIIVRCGIGKVNASIGASILLENYQVDLFINYGVVGSLSDTLTIGDVLYVDNFTYHDADATIFGYVKGQIPQMPASYSADVSKYVIDVETAYKVKIGHLITSDSFYADDHKIKEVKQHFPEAVILDMEAAAIAQTISYRDYELLSIKSISDSAGASADEAFNDNLALSAKNVTDAVLKTLASL
ncbi:5'-methylthioadenosine/adenosylhomocysteine nucleosidase [Carnobacterium viridans]|uniref:adenosylhomocysteine nucleosidase n=1 Tax=Carnobacterium viridans TaxID=174587 RepID=A0A1H0YDJ8_9LACT|nr:5'-methylthioadenosine/adenosylhomocysteine nucleosidase [Carnobacterium viridans]UDE95189.1 5'-methylthioadenosine/adenosylhomocysteine nucleosidase [Carnobacterium viridans]SDQ13315.1 adenosylhomocysteine nucleosidase [Carnobacterium viridans]